MLGSGAAAVFSSAKASETYGLRIVAEMLCRGKVEDWYTHIAVFIRLPTNLTS